MGTPHICSACRRSILASIRHRGAGQLRSRSTFVSPLSPPGPAAGDKVSEHILAVGASRTFNNGLSEPKLAGSAPREAGNSQRYRHPNQVDELMSLFEETRRAPSTRSPLANAETVPSILVLNERIKALKKLLARPDEPVNDIWQYFTSHLSASAWLLNTPGERPRPRPAAFKDVLDTLLQRLQMERMQSRAASHLPSVVEITNVYASLGMLNPSDWKVLVYDLLNKLAEQLVFPQDHQSTDVLTAISEDIIGAWGVLCKYYSPQTDLTDIGLGKAQNDREPLYFPVPPDLEAIKQTGGLDEVFLSLWPRCPTPYVSSITSAALSTFALVTDATSQKLRSVRHHEPFQLAMARFLVAARCDVEDILRSQAAGDFVLKDDVVNWSSALRTAEAMAGQPTQQHLDRRHKVIRPLDFRSTLLAQRLSRARTERSLKKIDDLWEEAKRSARPIDHVDGESGHKKTGRIIMNDLTEGQFRSKTSEMMSQELCNQFIYSYMAVRHPDRALDIWNYMMHASLPPNLSTWHCMLEGCRKARNHTSLEAVWKKLQYSSLLPNVDCWRTRINGLIECGEPELAIRALDEMGRNWRKVESKQPFETNTVRVTEGRVKPTIEIVNDIISRLLYRGYHNAAKSVLAWGDAFGIKADVVTFNILIRGLIHDGRVEAVPSLLDEMQKQGIQADVATFTTILDEIFKTSDPLSAEQQLDTINFAFTQMEAAGVQPNVLTYTKIISSLLQTLPEDKKVIQSVLARMAAQKIEPSRDIYTMLVQYHFSLDPPDVEGVRSLLDRIRVSGAVTDHIFWDRVIEGYASVGDTASALAQLGRLDSQGSRVGWSALTMVVQALAENREWELARQVVRNVKTDRGGPPRVDQKGVEGQHRFWRVVAECRLLDA